MKDIKDRVYGAHLIADPDELAEFKANASAH